MKKKFIYVDQIQDLYPQDGKIHIECEQGKVIFNNQDLFDWLVCLNRNCISLSKKRRKEVFSYLKKLK